MMPAQHADLGAVYTTVLEEVDAAACAFDDSDWAQLAGAADRLAEAAAQLRDMADVAYDRGVDGRSAKEVYADLAEHELLGDLAEFLHPTLATAHGTAGHNRLAVLLEEIRPKLKPGTP
ncbi:hypothetical protein Lfu02_69500 [Longispora fulva]|uniref:Putative metal-dependent hydrolase n=2 Tax=Longispora fulva TaxID=619741 RepID=A0A8J7KIQ3_9ACTN|nr:hypothetical protein [Longispora fulva]MBG6134511.1 putative metal-dependent hydrolase [Longispora fulva]GIG62578.1 hypothetical protein Lfu02_69500 [Longispora fulva]